MSRKSAIRAPKVPKGEDTAITLRNQENQIKLLISRCEELRQQVDAYAADCKRAETISDRAQLELDDVKQAYTRLEGWCDCAREMLRMRDA